MLKNVLSKSLILFSGQKDSVNTIINYSEKNPERIILLLYIKNVGFRQQNNIPLKSAIDLSKNLPNVKSLFVVDGGEVQAQLLKYISLSINLNQIYVLCILCQFSLNLIYNLLAQKLGVEYIIINNDVLGTKSRGILSIPYKMNTIQKDDCKKYQVARIQVDSLDVPNNKCLLSYTHNYDFEHINLDFEDIHKKLEMFVNTHTYSIKYNEIKF